MPNLIFKNWCRIVPAKANVYVKLSQRLCFCLCWCICTVLTSRLMILSVVRWSRVVWV